MRVKEERILRKLIEHKRQLIVASAWRLPHGWLWYCHVDGLGMIQREGTLFEDSETAIDTAISKAQQLIDEHKSRR